MLTDPWTISYGSFVFPLYSRSSITGKPVYDTARRAVSYIAYTLPVDSFILANAAGHELNAGPPNPADPEPGTVEAQLIAIRQQLQQRGAMLEIKSTGFGHLRVNNVKPPFLKGVDVRDVAYGPHPEILDAKTVGSRLAWKISWKCTFNIPECAEGTAVFAGRPMEFTYTWDVTQDPRGFSTRVVAGQLLIPATTVPGEKVPPDQADKYWNAVVASCPPLPSFRRDAHRTLSEDRRTLKFTITDTELPSNAFVPGATEWSGTQELSTNQQSAFRTWQNGITATYQVARGQSKMALYRQFLQ